MASGSSLGLGGQLLPTITMIRRLATGAEGAVWLVEQRQADGVVVEKAAKIYHECDIEEQAHRLRELNILLKLPAHPNLLSVESVHIMPDNWIIIMDFCPRDLFTESNRRKESRTPYSTPELVALFWGLTMGLTLLHQAGLVHRDFKQENVMLRHRVPVGENVELRSCDVAICDFGTAKALNDGPTTTVVGTSNYMAPEITNTSRNAKTVYDSRCDVWGLALCFFELTTLKRVSAVRNGAPTLDAAPITRELLKPLLTQSGVHWATDLVLSMLEVDPRKRMSSTEVLAALTPLVKSLPIKKTILFVDPGDGPRAIASALREADRGSPDVVPLTTTDALRQWLAQHQPDPLFVRIVTNRFRQPDNGEQAGPELIEWVKRKSGSYAGVPVLLFCGNMTPVAYLQDEANGVFVTDKSPVCVRFCAFEAMTPPASSSSSSSRGKKK